MRLKLVVLLGICLLGVSSTRAQQARRDSLRQFRVYTVEGKVFMVGQLDSVRITAAPPSRRELRRGQRRLRRFTRLRFNVHKVYPYAVKLAEILEEVQAHLDSLPSDRARKAYVENTEQNLFGAYEKDVRRMTRSQGKVLVKLVHRETDRSTYALIKDNKNGASAFFWQSVSMIFGINLKTAFQPGEEKEDAMIDYIVRDLENGGYNIAHRRYNYQLK
jgi:hypothetical protein